MPSHPQGTGKHSSEWATLNLQLVPVLATNLPTEPSPVLWGRGAQDHPMWVLIGWRADVGKANLLLVGHPGRLTLQVTLPNTTLGCTIVKPAQPSCVGGGKSPTTLQGCNKTLDPKMG